MACTGFRTMMAVFVLSLVATVLANWAANYVLTIGICLLFAVCTRHRLEQWFGEAPAADEVPPPTDRAPDGVPVDHDQGGDLAVDLLPSRPRRLLYLDNLKSFLTVLVVSHHTMCAFYGASPLTPCRLPAATDHVAPGSSWYYEIGNYPNLVHSILGAVLTIDQSYFMCVFFFVSGYFVPTSLERKGPVDFLHDRAVRFGRPYNFFTFVLQPLLYVIVKLGTGQPLMYGPGPGPLWFVGWLFLFNFAWAFYAKSVPGPAVLSWAAPSAVWLCILGALLGVAQLGLAAVGVTSFASMPVTFGSLPFDIASFLGGVAAKQNNWLSEALPAMGQARRWGTRAVCVLTAAPLVYLVSTAGASAPPALWLVAFVLAGVLCVNAHVALLDLFRLHFDFSTPWSRFFARTSYTVYIIHPFVVVPVTMSATAALNAWFDQDITFADEWDGSATRLSSPYLLVAGLAYTLVVSQLIVWPLAGWVRGLPGMGKVL